MDRSRDSGLNGIQVPLSNRSYLKGFRRQVERGFLDVLDEKLLVCILGPAKDSEFWRKRVEIKGLLEEKCGCACVFLEDELRAGDASLELLEAASLRALEAEILDLAELIIALDLTPGVLAEIQDFALDPDLAEKMLLLVPEWYGGYPRKSVLRETFAEKYLFDREELKTNECIKSCERRAILEKSKKHAGRRLIREAEAYKERYRYEWSERQERTK